MSDTQYRPSRSCTSIGFKIHSGGFGAPYASRDGAYTNPSPHHRAPRIHCDQKSMSDMRVSFSDDGSTTRPSRRNAWGSAIQSGVGRRSVSSRYTCHGNIATVSTIRFVARATAGDPSERRARAGARDGMTERAERAVPRSRPPQPRLLHLPPVGRVEQDVAAVGGVKDVRRDLPQRQPGSGQPGRHRRPASCSSGGGGRLRRRVLLATLTRLAAEDDRPLIHHRVVLGDAGLITRRTP